MLDIQTVVIFLFLGSFVGIISGLFGIGGGGIIVPVLTTLFLAADVSQEHVVHIALGTAMTIIIVTSFSSFRAQHKKGSVAWDIFRLMLPGVLLGTFLSTFIASQLSSFYLAIFFAIFMFYSAFQMFFGKKPKSNRKPFKAKGQFVAGGGIGALSALVSIGGGVLTVPYLVWQNIDIKKAIGTSSAIGFPLAISGTIGYVINGWSNTSMDTLMIGYVSLPALFFIALASYFTAPIGVKLVHKLPIDLTKKLFALLPLALSIKMIISLT